MAEFNLLRSRSDDNRSVICFGKKSAKVDRCKICVASQLWVVVVIAHNQPPRTFRVIQPAFHSVSDFVKIASLIYRTQPALRKVLF
jgi:hypothetical protein